MAIMKIITDLRAGETILDEDLTRISPLMHQHIILNGTGFACAGNADARMKPLQSLVGAGRTANQECDLSGDIEDRNVPPSEVVVLSNRPRTD